jgi:hypothetical protein
MITLKVEQLADGLAVRLTEEARALLGVGAGETVIVSRTPAGELSLSAADVDQHLRMERNRAVLRRYRNPV